MPPRVLLQSGSVPALQVSLPGVDVTTGSFDQMAYDGRFAHLSLFLKGSFVIQNQQSIGIPFGQTFSTIPRLICVLRANIQETFYHQLQAILTNHGSYITMITAAVTAADVTFTNAANDLTPANQPFYAQAIYYALYR
jgi:hypothetical protein